MNIKNKKKNQGNTEVFWNSYLKIVCGADTLGISQFDATDE